MPILITSEDTRFSFAYAVNSIQDNYSKNIAIRTLANSALTIAALVEVVAKGFFTALTLFAYPITKTPYYDSKAVLLLACRTVEEAAMGILGYSTPAPIFVIPTEPPIIEEEIEQIVTEEKPAPEVVVEPKSRWQISKKLVGTLLIVGGLSLAAYLLYRYQNHLPTIKIPRHIRQKLRPIIRTPEQKLANCVIESEHHWRIDGAIAAMNCNRMQDPNFTLGLNDGDEICSKMKKAFRTLVLILHPDKAISEDKDHFQNAFRILGDAKDKIQRRYCSAEAKIAKCVQRAFTPVEILKCAGEEVPKTCANLATFTQDLIDKIKKSYSDRERDLIDKIKKAYQQTSCYPVPGFIANWFTGSSTDNN